MKNILIAFLLVAVIALSGCTGTTEIKTDPNNGLVISEFSADPLKANDQGDSVLFLMDIENLGGVPAKNISLDIYGAEGWTGEKHKVINDMSPPDPVTDSPGDFQAITMILNTPDDLPQGVQANFPITTRVTFDYKTTGTISIPVYSKSLYKIKKDKGEVIDGSAKVENTYAPIQVKMSRGSTPLIVDDTKTTGTDTYGYLIEFVNVGSGWPISEGSVAGRVGGISGTIRVYGEGVTLYECMGRNVAGETFVTIEPGDVDVATMRSSGRVPVGCSVQIDNSAWAGGTTQSGSVLFTVDMDYRYYVEESANIMVWGGDA